MPPHYTGNLHPLLKGETLKNWLCDIFENRPGTHFQKSLKKGVLFQTILKKGSIFKLSLKKYPRPGPGTQAPMGYFFKLSLKKYPRPGPGTQVPMGYVFKLSLKMDPFFKIVWKRIPFFKLVWKWAPGRFSKMSPSHLFKVSPFDKGCKSLKVVHKVLRIPGMLSVGRFGSGAGSVFRYSAQVY